LLPHSFFFHAHDSLRALHSFPTRRSSDLWAGCGTSDHQMLTTPTAASPLLEQQAIANLFDLYRQALLQEDIDRLQALLAAETPRDRKSTRLNSSHEWISYAVFCLKKKKQQ